MNENFNFKPKIISSYTYGDQIIRTKAICPNCGNTASLIVGGTPIDVRFEQFHCDKCHCTFITADGKFSRFGVLNTEYW